MSAAILSFTTRNRSHPRSLRPLSPMLVSLVADLQRLQVLAPISVAAVDKYVKQQLAERGVNEPQGA